MAESAHRSRVTGALALAELGSLGDRLRAAGLTETAARVCFDVRCAGHAPLRAAELRPPSPIPPAAVLPWLLVAGKSLPIAAVRARLSADFDRLIAAGLLAQRGELVRATVTALPVGGGIAISDRAEQRTGTTTVLLPDDSAFHLLGTLPRRAESWLDVGTGNAIVPLAARGVSPRVHGTDVNATALDYARLGAALSRAGALSFAAADLFAGVEGRWQLVTFNAPIPAEVGEHGSDAPSYRRAPAGARLLERFWTEVGGVLADGGEVLVHSWQPNDDYPHQLELPGELIAVRYTPPSARHAFGLTRWRPTATSRRELISVTLTPDQPHVTRAAFE